MATGRAVDVLFVVDESGGMSDVHAWIQVAISDLETHLVRVGIGSSSTRNFYGLVGFGRGSSTPNGHLGHTLTLGDGRTMYPFLEFQRVAALLKADVDGDIHDGYEAIEHAIRNAQLRNADSIVRIMILVTDHDRDETREGRGFDRRSTQYLLRSNNFAFHVIAEQFAMAPEWRTAFGVNGSSWAFLKNDDLSGVVAVPNGRIGWVYGNTFTDYTMLGLTKQLDGSAWNIDFTRPGGNSTASFTRAFVEVVAYKAVSAEISECTLQEEVGNFQCD